MKYVFIVIILVLSAPNVKASTFVRTPNNYNVVRNQSEVQNMPKITSQDGLGICYAHVAATMLQTENCRILKQNCASLSPTETFSPLDLTRYHRPQDGATGRRRDYKNLKFDGGDIHNAIIIGGLMVGGAASEECVSLDKLLSQYDNREDAVELQAQMWERLKTKYEETKKLANGIDPNCTSCLDNIYATAAAETEEEFGQNLNLAVSNISLARAFARDTLGEFLDRVTGASKCNKTSQLVKFANPEQKYSFFPTTDSASPEVVKNKIRDVLKGGRPVSLGNLCLGQEPPNKCAAGNSHGVVIAGYREICTPSGSCRYAFKVVNSWGKTWQERNNDGWMDGETILKHTHIKKNIIGFFED